MKQQISTEQLRAIIGEGVSNIIVCDRYGDATLHLNGYVTADPCYLEDGSGASPIRDAMRAEYPWEGYDYLLHRRMWCEFDWAGQPCYFRDCSDGTGHFGHCVDSGCVVAVPLHCLPNQLQAKFTESVDAQHATA